MGKLKRALPLLLALTLCLGTSNLTAFAADNSDVDTDATTKSEQATTLTKDEVSDEDNPSKDDATLQTDNETNGETDGDENEDTTIGEDELNGTAPQNVETEDEAALTDAGEDTPDENSVAKVGDVSFASVQDAIDAAQAGDTVTLLKDVNVNATLDVSKSITIDGCNFAINSSASRILWVEASNVNITLENISLLTTTAERGVQINTDQTGVELSLVNCKVQATHYAVNITSGSQASLTIKDSTLEAWSALNVWGGPHTINISGSTLIGNNNKPYNSSGWNDFAVIVLNQGVESSTVNVSNSTVIAKTTTGNYQHIVNIQNIKNDGDPLPAGNKVSFTNCDIKAEGTTHDGISLVPLFYSESNNSLVVNGLELYIPSNPGEKAFRVPLNPIAKVNNVGFASVQDAIDAAQEGDTVTLLESTTESITVAAGQNITLNIPAGITLTNTDNKHTITVAEGATLTIEGQGMVDNISHEKTAIYNEGTTTLNGCTYNRSQETGKVQVEINSYYFIMNFGTMTINDGVSAQSTGNYSSLVLNGRQAVDGSISIPANLTINGGTLINGNTAVKNERGTVIINDGELASLVNGYSVVNYDTVELKGGNYVKSDAYAIWTAPDTTLTVSGGIFAAPVKAEYCAEGYIPAENADGTYGVIKDPSTEPTEPVDPVDPVDPVNPDPVDPVDPVNPDPVEPTEPVNPTDPATPTPGTNPQDRTPVIPSTTPTPTRTNLPAANNNAGEDATNPAIEEVTPDDAIPLASGLADDANDSKETTLDEDGTPLANAPTSTGSILPWILTGIIVVIAAAGLLWFLIAKRRKDDEEETPAHA